MAAPSHFVDTKKEPTAANGKGEKPGKPARITLGWSEATHISFPLQPKQEQI